MAIPLRLCYNAAAEISRSVLRPVGSWSLSQEGVPAHVEVERNRRRRPQHAHRRRRVHGAGGRQNPGQPEFHQAVREVVESVMPVVEATPAYRKAKILERMVEPERVIMFRVPWVDDRGEVQVNRGFRIQMNSAIGPYKGGLRFHPTVNLGVLKFLAFEQVFKNSLTTLLDGRRQGRLRLRSQGQERQRSDALLPVVHDRAVPPHRPGHRRAGRRHRRGRPRDRLPLRPVQEDRQPLLRRADRQGPGLRRLADPARGHRLRRGLLRRGDARPRAATACKGKTAAVSGSGNVAQYTVEKLIQLGAKADHALRLRRHDRRRGRHQRGEAGLGHGPEERPPRPDRASTPRSSRAPSTLPDKKPWGVKCDLAFPSATQNEIDGDDAKTLVENGCICVAEGREHAHRARRRRRLPRGQDPLRAGQGGQRRRRGRLGPGNDAERGLHAVAARGGRPASCRAS